MVPGSSLELAPSVFKILRDLICERTGLHFDEGKRQILADKLSLHVTERGFNSFLDFYYLLKYGPDTEREWPPVIDALSVQETYFWREMAQIKALVDEILPRHRSAFPQRPLKIWCAACATGEEPLTIAMALAEAGWFERAHVEIFASDASPAAIAKARRGMYRERSFRCLPSELRARYFRQEPDGWQVCSELKSRVTFAIANLVSDSEISALAQVPFLFCRNVFIYFTEDTIARTVAQFAQAMERPGYLFVGASESLLRITDEFDLQEAGEGFVYTLD